MTAHNARDGQAPGRPGRLERAEAAESTLAEARGERAAAEAERDECIRVLGIVRDDIGAAVHRVTLPLMVIDRCLEPAALRRYATSDDALARRSALRTTGDGG